jgi:hypothetical protein
LLPSILDPIAWKLKQSKTKPTLTLFTESLILYNIRDSVKVLIVHYECPTGSSASLILYFSAISANSFNTFTELSLIWFLVNFSEPASGTEFDAQIPSL